MKRFIYLLTSTIMAFVAVFSCKRAELEPEGLVDGMLYSFTAEYPEMLDESGKAVLDMSTGKTSWESGDKIRAFNGSSYADFTYDGTSSFTSETGLPYEAQYGFAMVYPSTLAGETQSTTGGNISLTLTLGDLQKYVDGKCKNVPLVAYAAQGSFNDVSFKHLCGYIGFGVTGDSHKGNFTAIKLTATGLYGDFGLSFTGTAGSGFEPTYTSTPSGSKTITLDGWSSTSGTTDAAKTYYMYVPYGTYTDASVKVYYADGYNDVGRSVPANPGLAISRSQCHKANKFFQTLFSGGGIDSTDGTAGSSADYPYLIKNQADLTELRASIKAGATNGKFYKLCNDITLSESWTPLGSADKPFEGTFIGGDHKISGITISRKSDHNGFFGYVSEDGTIKNLQVDCSGSTGIDVEGKNTGMLVGTLGGKVEYCTAVAGTVKSADNSVGGLVGQVVNSGYIKNSSVYGAVTVTSDNASFIGGVVGSALGDNSSSVVQNCVSKAVVSTTSGYSAGGIAGQLGGQGKIVNCKYIPDATTNVSATMHVGGIVGCAFSSYARGVAGNGSVHGCYVNKNAYIKGTRDSGDSNGGLAGGIVGLFRDGKISNCLFMGTVEAYATVGGIAGQVRSNETTSIDLDIINSQVKDCTLKTLGTTYAAQCGGIVGVYNLQADAENYNCRIINCIVNGATFDIAYSADGQSGVGGIVGRTLCKGTTKIYNNAVCLADATVKFPQSTSSKKIYYGGILGWAGKGATCDIVNNVVYTWHHISVAGSQQDLGSYANNKALAVAGVVGYVNSDINNMNIERAFVGNNYQVPCNYYGTPTIAIKNYVTRILDGLLEKGPTSASHPQYYGPALTAISGTTSHLTNNYSWNWTSAMASPTSGNFGYTPTATNGFTATNEDNILDLLNYDGRPTGSSNFINLNDASIVAWGRRLCDKYYYPVPTHTVWPDSFYTTTLSPLSHQDCNW